MFVVILGGPTARLPGSSIGQSASAPGAFGDLATDILKGVIKSAKTNRIDTYLTCTELIPSRMQRDWPERERYIRESYFIITRPCGETMGKIPEIIT